MPYIPPLNMHSNKWSYKSIGSPTLDLNFAKGAVREILTNKHTNGSMEKSKARKAKANCLKASPVQTSPWRTFQYKWNRQWKRTESKFHNEMKLEFFGSRGNCCTHANTRKYWNYIQERRIQKYIYRPALLCKITAGHLFVDKHLAFCMPVSEHPRVVCVPSQTEMGKCLRKCAHFN